MVSSDTHKFTNTHKVISTGSVTMSSLKSGNSQSAQTSPTPMITSLIDENNGFLRVLHVDDDESFLTMSKKFLEMCGKFKVETAFSVAEAFEKLRQTSYDVIVSDYALPVESGLQFLLELKKISCNLPFILFTSKGREEVAVEALNLGAFRYLNKFGDPEVVYTELASCILQAAERSAAQKLVEQSEERFRAIFEASSDAIVVLDDEGIIANLNAAALRVFKCTKKVVGQCFFDRFRKQFPRASKEIVLEDIRKFATDSKRRRSGKKIKLSLQDGLAGKRTIEVKASVFEQNNRIYSLALIREVARKKAKRNYVKGKGKKR